MLTTLHHVAVVVPTLEHGYKVFADGLGLLALAEATVEAQGVRAALLDAGGAEVELLEPLDAGNPIGRFLARGGGLHHICYSSTDVDADLTAAADAGADLIDASGRPGLAGRIGFLHPRSTGGILTEFAQGGGGVATTAPAARRGPADPAFGPLRAVEAAAPDPENAAAQLATAIRVGATGPVVAVGAVPVRFSAGEGRAALTGLVFEVLRPLEHIAARLEGAGMAATVRGPALLIDPVATCGVQVSAVAVR